MYKRFLMVAVSVLIYVSLVGIISAWAGEFPVCGIVGPQYSPAVSGRVVVWWDYRNGYDNIIGKDLATGVEFPICANSAAKCLPAISGNIVVWDDYRNGDSDIYGKDITTGVEFPVCVTSGNQGGYGGHGVAISDNIVVWMDMRNGNSDIYGKDLITGVEFPVCTNMQGQLNPAISGDIVVWIDHRNGYKDIYGKDLSTGEEFAISTNTHEKVLPAISGNIVVWTEYDGVDADIYGKNLATGEVLPICTDTRFQRLPAISGNIVVWTDMRNMSSAGQDIYGKDLSTGLEFPVCTQSTDQDYVAVSNNLIVWMDYRNQGTADSDIYGTSLDTAAPMVSTAFPTNGATNVPINSNISLTFDKVMYQPDTQAAFSISPNVSGSFSWNAESSQLTFTPTAPLANDTTYTVTLATGARDIARNGLAVPGSWQFATIEAIPDAPSGTGATAMQSTRIDLSWQDNSSNESGFRIERKAGASGMWSQIGTVGANETNYSDTGLSTGTTYYYRVRAYNNGGNSGYSNEASTTTFPLEGPSYLSATPASASRINLVWKDNSANEAGFYVERKIGASGSWSRIARVGANIKSCSNTSLAAHTTYYYRVRAYNASGNSPYSNEASVTTAALNGPSGLLAKAVSASQIRLKWGDYSSDESGYKIERKSGKGQWAEVATVRANVTGYYNTGLTPGTQHRYRVRAYNASGYSLYSNEASATTWALPAAPTNLAASLIPTNRCNLSWTDNSTNESGFKIECRVGSSSTWSLVTTVRANTTSYLTRALRPATTYHFRVQGYNANGPSANSNEASITTGR